MPREFFIGRYIYLKDCYDKTENYTFTHCGEGTTITYRGYDKSSGKIIRRRFSENSPRWEQIKPLAEKRTTLKNQLKTLLDDWSREYSGSLRDLAAHYKIVIPEDRTVNPELWSNLSNNQCTISSKSRFMYKGIAMRSQFETVIASIIDELHLEFKYDVMLLLRKGYVCPDFAVNLPEYRKCGFIEYLGALQDFGYLRDNIDKIDNYLSSGIYIGRELTIISGDKYYRPNNDTIRSLICSMVGEIARQHVMRID